MFQDEFQELVVRFRENEKIIQDIPVTGSDLAEVNAHLDSLENLMEVTSQLESMTLLVWFALAGLCGVCSPPPIVFNSCPIG